MSLPSPHRIIEPEGWRRPRGYSNGMVASGRFLAVSGQIGWDAQERLVGPDLVSQARQALRNVVAVVEAAGGRPEHVVRLTWYLTDREAYLASGPALGAAYREVMGRHFPAMSAVQVVALVETGAVVEIEATAILPA